MKKILVIVDLQNDFIDGPLGNEQTRAVVEKVVEKIKSFNGDQLVVTMDTHNEKYLETQEGQKLPVKHCIPGTKGWKLNQKVQDAVNNLLPNKVQYSCKKTFGSIALPVGLKEDLGITDWGEDLVIEMCGICTGICVISNAMLLKAHFPEAKIIVDASCCACVTSESHNTALEAMKMCQIDVIGEEE